MTDPMVLRSTFRLLLLLTVVVLAAVGSKNEQTSLDALSKNFPTTPASTNNTVMAIAERVNERDEPSLWVHAGESVKAKDVVWDEEEDDEDEEKGTEGDDEQEEEDEAGNGSEVDEYEDELRGIAESHEAMSKHERKNHEISSTTSLPFAANDNRDSHGQRVETKNFESREKSDEIMSDESSIFNEAALEDDDEEVAELLRYKQKGPSSQVDKKVIGRNPNSGTIVKRVPTVKKELSTQKEILNANETELPTLLPKSSTTNSQNVNRLDDYNKQHSQSAGPPTPRVPSPLELVRDDRTLDEEYSDVDAPGDILRKLDKRQPFELNGGLKSHFLDAYDSEREQRRKLRELGFEEGALAENFVELLTRLADNPRLWDRVHQILEEFEGGPSYSEESLMESRKRGYSTNSLIQIPMTDAVTEGPEGQTRTTKRPKKKKKKKRRKKKPRNRLMSSSTTAASTTTPTSTVSSTTSQAPGFLTTAASVTNWRAPTPQWRLVAERLFGDPWSDDRRRESSSSSIPAKDRPGPIDQKQRESLKSLNDERQALMLESAREYAHPRRLHYGKVNTHEKETSASRNNDNKDLIKNFDRENEEPLMDYDLSDTRPYQDRLPTFHDRWDQYGRTRMQEYGFNVEDSRNDDDYDEIIRTPAANERPFARTQLFRPPGREYATTKTWQDSRYGHGRPWKDQGHSRVESIPRSTGNWPWRSASDYKVWVPKYQTWPRDSHYWQRSSSVEDELEDIEANNDPDDGMSWQRETMENNWKNFPDESARWQIERNLEAPVWSANERSKAQDRDSVPIGLEKNKNLSEFARKIDNVEKSGNDKPMLPKITMKTWNSLTSDPATWPFKLNGAKPWPKDKNGKSYNPNAELVRKLGLDKQDHLLSSSKDSKAEINKEIVPQDRLVVGRENENGRKEIDAIGNSVKNSISWPDKLNAINGWRSKSRPLSQPDESAQIWKPNVDEDRNIWAAKSAVSPKISSVGAWVMPADQSTWRPYDLKHKSYGKMGESHRGRWKDLTNSDPSEARSWSSKNQDIGAAWPQKMNNDWNVVDPVFPPSKSASNVHSSTWPSKWRQFAYHKVTAGLVPKAGALNPVDGSSRPRNAYIAVSAVSPPKYQNNEWRKNDIEDTQLDPAPSDNRGSRFDQDDLSSQLRKSLNEPNEPWGNQATMIGGKAVGRQRNEDDSLDHQLESLRQEPYWHHGQPHQHDQKRSNVSAILSTNTTTTPTSPIQSNSSSTENAIFRKDDRDILLTKSHTERKTKEKK